MKYVPSLNYNYISKANCSLNLGLRHSWETAGRHR